MIDIDVLEKKITNECNLYSGTPVAVSGGIDSGLLAALIKPRFIISVELPGGEKYNEIEYSKKVAKHLGLEHIIVKLDNSKFDEDMKIAVKAIGRPIPHFNIFPLFEMYKTLAEMGEKRLILGDGPDETMCGYTRHLIMKYLYWDTLLIEAFKNYQPMFGKLMPSVEIAYAKLVNKDEKEVYRIFSNTTRQGKNILDCMCAVDMKLMRPDMDDMSNGIAKYFGIKNIRPYQDNRELDEFMFNLPPELKVGGNYGKLALRIIAQKYLPKYIAWRKVKVGGPVYPVNKIMGWMEDGEFGKSHYLKYQEDILNEK
jgi:asparagine synthase (glutamine-hydrolysing)